MKKKPEDTTAINLSKFLNNTGHMTFMFDMKPQISGKGNILFSYNKSPVIGNPPELSVKLFQLLTYSYC